MKKIGIITASVLVGGWFIWIISGMIMLLSGGLVFNDLQRIIMTGSMVILGISTIYWCFCYILILRKRIDALERKYRNRK